MTEFVQPRAAPGRHPPVDKFLAEIRAMHREREQMAEVLKNPAATERFLTACGDSFDPKSWTFQARLNQLPPVDLDWCLLWLAGRGWGKSRSLSGCVHAAVRGGIKVIHLITPSHKAFIETNIEGHSGILATCGRHDDRPRFVAQRQRLEWPGGARLSCFSAATEALDQLRGPSCELLLIDELAAMPKAQQVFDLAWQGCRLGTKPRVIVATTPRPIPLLKKLIAMDGVSIVRGTTFDNAENLPPEWLEQLRRDYDGTQMGRQELRGELILQPREAMFQEEWFRHEHVDPKRIELISVGIDPAFAGDGDDCGIVVCGLLDDGGLVVLADRTVAGSPATWGEAGVKAHDDFATDCDGDVVVEVNSSGIVAKQLVKDTAARLYAEGKRSSDLISVKDVTATKGKLLRAEPISLLYEKGRVIHHPGLGELEAEMVSFSRDFVRGRDKSPNRLDALVWALTRLAKIKTSIPIA